MKIAPFKFHYFHSNDELILEREIELPDQGIIYLAGNSGTGKSTFLKILKGFHPEFLPGELYSNFKSFDQALYLFQNPFTQIIHQNIKNEIFFSAENERILLEMDLEKNSELQNWLNLLNLNEIFKSKISLKSLSHGENQRLLLLSLILAQPKILFLDEPTAFLDKKNREIVYEFLSEYKKQACLFLIDHHQQEVSSIVDENIYFSRHAHKVLISKNFTVSDTFSEKILINENLEKAFSENMRLSVRQISFDYGDEKKIFQNLSFEVSSGECLAIIGKSGIGKSTLLKIIMGELKPKHGEIVYPYKDAYKSCSILFQNPELHFMYESVEEEIKNSELIKKIPELLTHMRLQDKLHLNPFLLSEGEKRRLSFLIAQNRLKPILLLDEPTFGLDLEQVHLIQEMIRFFKKLGAAIIVISHDRDFYETITNKVLDLEKNQLEILNG